MFYYVCQKNGKTKLKTQKKNTHKTKPQNPFLLYKKKKKKKTFHPLQKTPPSHSTPSDDFFLLHRHRNLHHLLLRRSSLALGDRSSFRKSDCAVRPLGGSKPFGFRGLGSKPFGFRGGKVVLSVWFALLRFRVGSVWFQLGLVWFGFWLLLSASLLMGQTWAVRFYIGKWQKKTSRTNEKCRTSLQTSVLFWLFGYGSKRCHPWGPQVLVYFSFLPIGFFTCWPTAIWFEETHKRCSLHDVKTSVHDAFQNEFCCWVSFQTD